MLCDLGVSDFDILHQGLRNPVVIAIGEMNFHGGRGLACRCLFFDFGVKVKKELALSCKNLRTAGRPVSGKHGNRMECFCAGDYTGPVGDIAIQELIAWTVDRSVPGTQDALLREPYKSISAGVGPAKKVEADLAGAILQNEGALAEGLLWAWRIGQMQIAHIFSLRRCCYPTLRLVPVHLVEYAFVGQSGGAGICPDDISV